MDESELLALLTGIRTSPIRLGRISAYRARLIGATTTVVMLSPYTLGKQESKHRDETLNLYRVAAASLCSDDARIDPPRKINFLFCTIDGKEYRSTIKANEAGTEIYLASVHELKKNQWKATVRRTLDEQEWEHQLWTLNIYGRL
jgi:hypothetical protein